MKRFLVWQAATLAALIVYTAAALPAAAQQPCRDDAEQELAKLGVAAEDLDKIVIGKNRSRRDGESYLVGYSAWSYLKTCDGAVVIDLSKECWVQQIYTRGACRLDGVRSC